MVSAGMRLLGISLALLLVCRISTAQVATARLEGIVRDPSGAVVPGASVRVVNNRTQVSAEASTTSEGRFAIASLQPGVYTLHVEAAGFRSAKVDNLELTVGATVPLNVRLELGNKQDLIVVEAAEERVQVTDAQVARAVTLRDIEVLPQLLHVPITLSIFSAGVQVDTNLFAYSRVNGTRQGSTNTRLDGIDVNDNSNPNLFLSNIKNNSDSIGEFRIVTGGGKAEYGRNAGAQIELITRSGANVWHGNAFEYHRNTALNANNFFNNKQGLERPKYIQNTFGASLGGPIRRDRTFIFGNYQGQRNAQELPSDRFVLTPEAKKGLFRWKSTVNSEIQPPFDIVRNDPRGKGIDPKVAELLKLLPDPNHYDIGDGLNIAGFRFNNPITPVTDSNEDQFTIKADHTLWSRHHLFFRWAWSRSWYTDNINNNEARFPGQPPGIFSSRNWGYSIGSDWTITSRLVNELRVGYKTYTGEWYQQARLPGPMLLANSWTDPLNPAFSSSREPPVRQLTDNLTIFRGRHTLKGGIEWRLTTERRSSDAGIWPNVTFATSPASVPASIGPQIAISTDDRKRFENLYNDLLGRMNQVTQTFYSDLKSFQPAFTPRVRTYRFREFAGFFQDDWKIHPRMVLNLGLRYEFFGVPLEVNGIQGTVDKASLIVSAARINDLTIQPGSRWYESDFNNFAPRIGLAWDPADDGKTSLRASWGIFYDRLIGATTSLVDANTPGFMKIRSVDQNQADTDIRVSDGMTLPQPPAVPELCPPADRVAQLVLFSPNLRTGYVQHYSLMLQREIFRNTVIEAGYVGTHGIKLFMDINLNQPRIYEDFLPAFLELQAFKSLGTPVSASNALVRIFGSPAAAIKAIGANTIDQGAVGYAADSMDRNSRQYPLYANAGLSDFYLRNFPQFNRVIVGTNDGRSYYDSLQVSLRRQAGALKFAANYTFSKSMDNISAEGFLFTSPIDNFNVRLNRARGDYDMPHAFNASLAYTLPVGKERHFAGNAPRWVDSLIGGWDVGVLTLWQSGRVVTYQSGRSTGPTTGSSYVNYSGDRNIGKVIRKADGVYWLTEEEISRFSYPAAGEIGTGGRNAFRGPRYFNVDVSLVKKFKIGDRHAVSFRAEAYNLFNNVNFATPNNNLAMPSTFGKIPNIVGNPRFLQLALRYEF